MMRLTAVYGSLIVTGGNLARDADGSVSAGASAQFYAAAAAAGERAAKAGFTPEQRQQAGLLIDAWIAGIVSTGSAGSADPNALLASIQRLGTAPYRPEDDDIRELALLLLEFGLLAKDAKRIGREGELDVLKTTLRDGLGRRLAVMDPNLGSVLTPDAYKALTEITSRPPARPVGNGRRRMPVAASIGGAVFTGLVALAAYQTKEAWLPYLTKTPAAQTPAAETAPAPPPVATEPAALPQAPGPETSTGPSAPPEPAKPAQAGAGATPATSPVLAPAAMDQLLSQFTCAELNWTSDGGNVQIRGHVAAAEDKTKLAEAAAKVPGVGTVTDEVTVLGPPLCSVFEKLEPARKNNLQRALALDLRIDREDALSAGTPLTMAVNVPVFDATIYVDLFGPDGKVRHMVPNTLDKARLIPARALYAIGKAPGTFKTWTVGEPFGDYVVVTIASRSPLFAGPRPEIEDAVSYLAELSDRVTSVQQQDPDGIAAAMRSVVFKPPG